MKRRDLHASYGRTPFPESIALCGTFFPGGSRLSGLYVKPFKFDQTWRWRIAAIPDELGCRVLGISTETIMRDSGDWRVWNIASSSQFRRYACDHLWRNGFFGASTLTGGELLETDVEKRAESRITRVKNKDALTTPIQEDYTLFSEECIFLSGELNAISILHESLDKRSIPKSINELWRVLILPEGALEDCTCLAAIEECIRKISLYVSYSFYRVNGWIVRPGTKFGTDWVLYKRGPVFDHAKYGVVVISESKNGDQDIQGLDLLRISRILNHAKKKLVLCYVKKSPAISTEDLIYYSCTRNFSVNSLVFERFIPEKLR